MTHTYDAGAANRLGALAVALGDELARATAESADVGASGAAALVSLDAAGGGERIESLRRRLGLTHSGTVRLVDRLVAAGHVERRAGSDARSVGLALTPTGRRAARRVRQSRETVLQRAMAGFSAVQREQLDRLVTLVLETLVPPTAPTCRLCDREACGASCPLEPERSS